MKYLKPINIARRLILSTILFYKDYDSHESWLNYWLYLCIKVQFMCAFISNKIYQTMHENTVCKKFCFAENFKKVIVRVWLAKQYKNGIVAIIINW